MTELQLVERILIFNGKAFEGKFWKEAVLVYLNGLWTGEVDRSHRTAITFNGTTLHGRGGCHYQAGASNDPGMCLSQQLFNHDKVIMSVKSTDRISIDGTNGLGVEAGLARFVKNDQIRQLVLSFNGGMDLFVLAKGRPDTELYLSEQCLPHGY